ncbi:MAG: YgiQ family radical SAM protein [Elusimicrobiota bacterium]
MFIPTTLDEVKNLGWNKLDIILVTGDTYIDSPYTGIAVIGKLLCKAGYKVGIIAQPTCRLEAGVAVDSDIKRLGEPSLFWGVTSGCVDSMVANYTATKKRRKQDDFTPGGINNKRPDRAVIAYSNLIRRFFKSTKPIVLGGLEASLRRVSHYDYWNNEIRRSILFDAKADFLVYGMGEKAILEIARKLKNNESTDNICGICYASNFAKDGYNLLPSYEEVKTNSVAGKQKFTEMFQIFYSNNNSLTASGICQKQDTRYLIQNPPQNNLTEQELDEIYDMDFERDVHPYYKKNGMVRALETIRFSITTHRGCYGECNFCSIAVHQGTTVVSRSEKSILDEAKKITKLPDFKGYISDVGGPTANMYGTGCTNKEKICVDKRCVYPEICKGLDLSHKKQLELLIKLRALSGVKKVFVASGVRHDLVLEDKKYGLAYLKELILHHISGQLKISPEHTEEVVLKRMGKSGKNYLKDFKKLFDELNKHYCQADLLRTKSPSNQANLSDVQRKQFLTYYFIAAHPGCGIEEMKKLKQFVLKELKLIPEQLQIFTPTPSTYSTLMYYIEQDPNTCENIFVEKDISEKAAQKEIILSPTYKPKSYPFSK